MDWTKAKRKTFTGKKETSTLPIYAPKKLRHVRQTRLLMILNVKKAPSITTGLVFKKTSPMTGPWGWYLLYFFSERVHCVKFTQRCWKKLSAKNLQPLKVTNPTQLLWEKSQINFRGETFSAKNDFGRNNTFSTEKLN